MLVENEKFKDPFITAKGDTRAWVDLNSLDTLWFNTGTLCNLSCNNCYIESSPTNDQLVYLNRDDLIPYLQEINEQNLNTKMIAFTGGEPFINPNIRQLIEETLNRGFSLLILTNAYRVLKRHEDFLIKMNRDFPSKLYLRISLDHYTEEVHEKERSSGTFLNTIKQLQSLYKNNIQLSLAGRSLVDESVESSLRGYQNLLDTYEINIKLELGKNIVVFPEMILDESVPEITTDCWDILNKNPDQQMCASERMIVKRKGTQDTVILPCTLLAYDKQFELGKTLKESNKRVQLNHVYCAKFCVLGGASCSSAK